MVPDSMASDKKKETDNMGQKKVVKDANLSISSY